MAIAEQTPSTTEEGARALSIHYADGRTTSRILRQSGNMWTPLFLRRSDAETTRDGLPLKALDVAHVVEGRQVVVTISLRCGALHERKVLVSALYRQAHGETAATLRAKVARLGVNAGPGGQQIQDAALSDLDSFQTRGGQPPGLNDWLAHTITDYDRWLARIDSPSKR